MSDKYKIFEVDEDYFVTFTIVYPFTMAFYILILFNLLLSEKYLKIYGNYIKHAYNYPL